MPRKQPEFDPVKVIPIIPRRLRLKDAARYIATSGKHLRKLAQDGQIPFSTVGNGPTAPWVFDVHDLDAFVEKSKITL